MLVTVEASLALVLLLLLQAAVARLLLHDDWLLLVVAVVAAVQLSSVAELVAVVDAVCSADAV